MHVWLGMCVLDLGCLHALFANLIRSATVFVACLFNRQCTFTFIMGWGSVYGWYHAGRVAQTWGESLIATRLVLYLFTTFSILIMPSFSVASLGPLDGGSHDCRNVLTTAIAEVPYGEVVLISISDTIAQGCLDGVRFR